MGQYDVATHELKNRTPVGLNSPAGITLDRGGNIWITNSDVFNPAIARIAQDGSIRILHLHRGVSPIGIAASPDGTIWFSVEDSFSSGEERNGVGYVENGDVLVERAFRFPKGARVNHLFNGRNGEIWAADNGSDQLIRIPSKPRSSTTRGYSFAPVAPITAIGPALDGAMWAVQPDKTRIAKISADGVITDFQAAAGYSGVSSVAADPAGDGAWFTESVTKTIGHYSAATGTVVVHKTLPTSGATPDKIVSATDGTLWFLEEQAVGRIDAGGTITEASVPARPAEISQGADGRMWFSMPDRNSVGWISMQTMATGEVLLSTGSSPNGIAVTGDGNVWIAETGTNKIARLDPSGDVTEFGGISAGAGPLGIAVGPDGDLWFTESSGSNFGHISRSGKIVEYTQPATFAHPLRISMSINGDLWMVNDTHAVARISAYDIVHDDRIFADDFE